MLNKILISILQLLSQRKSNLSRSLAYSTSTNILSPISIGFIVQVFAFLYGSHETSISTAALIP